MLSQLQTQLIHIAVKEARLNRAQYEMLLQNLAGVKSSKDLSQWAFEDVMAILETKGFRQRGKAPDYWRQTVDRRGVFAHRRQVWVIRQLAEECRYDLGGLCERFSLGRTREPELLYPREAWGLTEGIKKMVDRGETKDGEDATLFGLASPPGATSPRPRRPIAKADFEGAMGEEEIPF